MNKTVTVLTAPGKRLCKYFSSATSESWQSAKYFTATEISLSGIEGFYSLIRESADLRNQCIIRGRLRADADHSKPVRRQLNRQRSVDPNEEAFEDVPREWIMIDIDKLALPSQLKTSTNPAASVNYAISLLPEEFRNKTCVWQLSASCCLMDDSIFSAHLFFWLSELLANEHLRLWAKNVNVQAGIKLIDPALFNAVQIHYTANPIFDGREDPIKADRVGIIRGASDEVSLIFKPPQKTEQSRSTSDSSTVRGLGYEGQMAYLGDGQGNQGFNDVLLKATAKFVAARTKEMALGELENLKADVRRRIDAADQNNHSQTDIDRYKSDAYLDPLILGAIEKFSESTPPYWDKPLMTLSEGEKRLREVIDNFSKQAIASWDNPLDFDTPIFAIRATAGLGKTRSVIKQLLAYKLLEYGDVHYYVPNHRLSRELEADLNDELTLDLPKDGSALKRARVIYGRSQKDASGTPMCRKATVANAISKAGGSAYQLLCKNNSGQCEFFDNCAYLDQLDEVDALPDDMKPMLTEVKVMSHNHLFYRTKERFLEPSLVVIDESFIRTPHVEVKIPISDILSFGDPSSHIAAVANILSRGAKNILGQLRALFTSHDLLEELDEYESIQANLFSTLRIDDSLQQQERVAEKLQSNDTPLLIRTLAYEMQVTDRDESNAVISDGKEATVLRRRDLHLPDAPLLLIDADANPLLLKQFFGDRITVEDIRVERDAEVYQFSDRTFSKTAFDKNPELITQVGHFISSVSASGKTLVVSNKGLEESLAGLDVGDATLDHFNNLRGVNLYSDFENIIIVGRIQPSSVDIEKLARGLWYDAEEPFALLEEKSGSRPLESEKRGYRLKGDSGSAMTQVHPDWRVQALLEQMRESESTQAIDRLRLLRPHPEGLQRRVFILCSVPLDVTVDHLESWSGLQKMIALVQSCDGIVPLNKKHLLAACPELSSQPTAQRRITDLKRITSLISISIRGLILLTAQYKLRGQKRASEVLYDARFSSEQVQKRLEQLTDDAIEMLEGA